tara:strand:+ start:725 stop:1762 length:1038 start_codon:yes stop_codon:yes gene_type:complete
MGKNQNLKICLLSDNKKGHLIKSEGILDALSQALEIEVFKVEVRWKLGFLRKLLLSSKVLRDILPISICVNIPQNKDFDLIISSGGATEWVNSKLAILFNSHNLYIGTLRHCSPSQFTFLAVKKYKDHDGFLDMPIVPNVIKKDRIAVLAEQYFPNYEGNILTIIIGGNGSGITWSVNDFNKVLLDFIRISNENNAGLIIVTSRRTSKFMENMILKFFEDYKEVLKICIYNTSNPEIPNRDFYEASLGVAESIFVSEDSASMVSESIAAEKKVFCFRPDSFKGVSHNHELFEEYSNNKKLVRLNSLGSFRLCDYEDWVLPNIVWQKNVASKILSFTNSSYRSDNL